MPEYMNNITDFFKAGLFIAVDLSFKEIIIRTTWDLVYYFLADEVLDCPHTHALLSAETLFYIAKSKILNLERSRNNLVSGSILHPSLGRRFE